MSETDTFATLMEFIINKLLNTNTEFSPSFLLVTPSPLLKVKHFILCLPITLVNVQSLPITLVIIQNIDQRNIHSIQGTGLNSMWNGNMNYSSLRHPLFTLTYGPYAYKHTDGATLEINYIHD